jgi:hypothetical protein
MAILTKEQLDNEKKELEQVEKIKLNEEIKKSNKIKKEMNTKRNFVIKTIKEFSQNIKTESRKGNKIIDIYNKNKYRIAWITEVEANYETRTDQDGRDYEPRWYTSFTVVLNTKHGCSNTWDIVFEYNGENFNTYDEDKLNKILRFLHGKIT